jgi:tRNA1Val (adenine37-N6)-methyltransferase
MSEVPWPPDASRDRLIGDWFLWQRRGGHRTSTDDLLTAWAAAANCDGANRYLDLGCGIGSVLLQVAHCLRPLESVGVEAQEQSALMAARTVNELPEPPPISILHQDLRSVDSPSLGSFDLITGSPPYLPSGTGVVSPDPQRAACRFELRGGVEEYCTAARRLLAQDGWFFLVFQSQWDARVVEAGRSADLFLRWRADIRTRLDREEPFLTLYGFRREDGPLETVSFATRDANGTLTADYAAARQRLGHDR